MFFYNFFGHFRSFLCFALLLSCGFKGISQVPSITSFSPTSGPVGTLLTVKGKNFSNVKLYTGTTVVITSSTDTTITGLIMPGSFTTRIIVTNSNTYADTSGSNFIVTPTQIPYVQHGGKLVGTGSVGTVIYEGLAVSVSADGNTAIIGGYGDNNRKGAVWVYTRINGVWTQQGSKLVGTGSVGPNQDQGFSVSLSADGNTAIIGGENQGAWVFTRSNGAWTQQGNKLIGIGGIGVTNQGISVSLSADGNTAIIGGNYDNNNIGAAWVFTRSNGMWNQQGNKLVGIGNTGAAGEGISVSLSADGNTAIIGGNYDNNNIGAAWVFSRSNGVWAQQGNKLVGIGSVGQSRQGWSVTLSADGNTALIGGYYDNSYQGAAWVYTRNNGNWNQQGNKLVGTGSMGANVYQGSSVSLSADGDIAVVGASSDNNGIGAVWLHARNHGLWTQSGSKLIGSGSTGTFPSMGTSVSLSADASTIICGGPGDNEGIGAAWAFTVPPPRIYSFSPFSGPVGTIVTIKGNNLSNPSILAIGEVSGLVISKSDTLITAMVMPTATTGSVLIMTPYGKDSTSSKFTITPTGYPNKQQGNKLIGTGNIGPASQAESVAISADGNTIIMGGSHDNSNLGATWVFTKTDNVWSQQGAKLISNDAIGAAQQGFSVAVSGDGNTLLVGGINDNNGIGAAWVFVRSGNNWMQQGSKLVGSGAVGKAAQGISVGLSLDGNIALIGGWIDSSNNGASWIFARNNNLWTQQGNKLVGKGNVGPARQGRTVGLGADGKTAIIGGVDDNNYLGAVWIFTLNNGFWIQQGNKLVGNDFSGMSNQGRGAALTADGNTAVWSGSGDGNNSNGATWVFTRNNGTWTQQGSKLQCTGYIGYVAQQDVAISADGNILMIGGSGDNAAQGATWIFKRTNNVWTQVGSKLKGSGNIGNANQGYAISMTPNGETATMDGPSDNSGQGASWVFIANNNPLPVSFIRIEGVKEFSHIRINWKVADAFDSKKYVVMRSLDGVNFAYMASVSSSDLQAYSYVDQTPREGIYFYRVKAETQSGQFVYSEIVKVVFGGGEPMITVYPNPVTLKSFTASFNSEHTGNYVLAIFNEAGQNVYHTKFNHNSSTSKVAINLPAGITKGTYQMSIMGPDKVHTTKSFIIEACN